MAHRGGLRACSLKVHVLSETASGKEIEADSQCVYIQSMCDVKAPVKRCVSLHANLNLMKLERVETSSHKLLCWIVSINNQLEHLLERHITVNWLHTLRFMSLAASSTSHLKTPST